MGRPADRGQQTDDLYGTVLRLQDLHGLAGDAHADPRFGNLAQLLDDQTVEGFWTVQGKLRSQLAVEPAQRRHAVDGDAAVGIAAIGLAAAAGGRGEVADDLLDDVLD